MDSNRNKFVRFKDSIRYWRSSSTDTEEDSSMVGRKRGVFDAVHNSLAHFPSSLLNEAARLLSTKKQVVDPQGSFLEQWNKGFLLLCLFALALEPLFFYIPIVDRDKKCIDQDNEIKWNACILRTVIDFLYVFHMGLQFRIGFIPPSPQMSGRGDLVDDPVAIARKYLSSYFLLDVLAILPLPQVLFLGMSLGYGSKAVTNMGTLKYIIFLQYLPRAARIYQIYKQVKRNSAFLAETAWAGASLNLILYMLAAHTAGAFWYLFATERQYSCWNEAFCGPLGMEDCAPSYFYCDAEWRPSKIITSVNSSCPLIKPDEITDPTTFNFGIFINALQSRIVESKRFDRKLSYCFWWGLRNLSSLGQSLEASTFVGENVFTVGISIFGLLLFAGLIGNMQAYLQSATIRAEEMRVKRRDAEHWMSHRMLPEDLRKRIRRYQQYKWQQTRGVEEDSLIRDLPKDLRRDIKRHLCLNSLMRVPMFEKMDGQLIDGMCDRLKPILYTEKSTIIREGDPVDEILFIIRGSSLTMTTNGGRTGFFNSDFLKEGDFCGEELLTWALDPTSSSNLPTSTRTVVTISEVEAFALAADDLKFVASQFRRLHSKQLKYTFRFHSQQWRSWGACFIQAAWRRHCKRKREKALHEAEDMLQDALLRSRRGCSPSPSLGATIYASRFATNALRLIRSNPPAAPNTTQPLTTLVPLKPNDPNFAIDE